MRELLYLPSGRMSAVLETLAQEGKQVQRVLSPYTEARVNVGAVEPGEFLFDGWRVFLYGYAFYT